MPETLSARVERLREQVEQASTQRINAARNSPAGRAAANYARTTRFLYQVLRGLQWLWETFVQPIIRLIKLAAKPIWNAYKWFWDKIVYTRVGIFSRTRAGLILLATGGVLWFVISYVPFAFIDALLYMTTARVDEHLILLGSQQINHHTGVHIVEGCEQLPCSDQNSIYLRTDDDILFDDLWSLSHGRGLFYSEYIGAAVPNNISDCVITSYGFPARGRFRFAFRLINVYSYILSVSCQPLGSIGDAK